MKISFNDISSLKVPYSPRLKSLAKRVITGEGQKGLLNLVFCDNPYIRELNHKFRKLNKATDVLSFYYGEQDIFGEIYISTEKAKRQAPKWKNTYYQELKRLVVHGCLHLCGYDHKTKAQRQIMELKEREYLKP